MASVGAVVERWRRDHEVSILIAAEAGVGRCLGLQPRAKVSMMIMRPPQQGHGRGSTRGSSTAVVLRGSGCFARDALPTMYQARELVAAGGLMSYGSSLADMYRQMGVYAGKVLNGANPAEMPVLQPIKFEMAINLQAAKALGLKLPDNLLSLADEVIE